MKKQISSFIVTLVIATGSHLTALDSFKLPEAISRVNNQITVGVHPEVELISIVQTISKYPTALGFLMAQDSSRYKTDVINQFKPYSEYPAVLMFDRLSLIPGGLNFSAPSNIMLYTNSTLHLREDIELDDFVIKRSGGIDSLRVFLQLLGVFAIQSSFNEFFEKHQAFYLNIIENTIGNLGPTDYISEIYDKT